jgi:acetoin utilization protein AcuB
VEANVDQQPALLSHQYPTVRQYMTPSPWTVDRNQPLSAARRLMHEHGVRHLPVLEGQRVLGVLSERDLLLCESLAGVNPTDVRVEEAMAPDPYAVTPDAALADVVDTLIQRRIDSAIVLEEGRVVGVFTTVDALRALADLLEEED